MNAKVKKIVGTSLVIGGLISLGALSLLKKQLEIPVIGITQIVEHPSLDEERQGIIEALAEEGFIDGQNIKIIYKNAQGNMATAAQIASSLAGQKPAVLVGISTPSAQSLLRIAQKHGIPLVFSAVTDPVGSQIISSLNTRSENITGVSDHMSLESQLELLQQIIPNLKKIGVIFNPGETNSQKMVAELRLAATQKGIQILEASIQKTTDVKQAVTQLVGNVQAIYLPNDNAAASAASSIVQIAKKHSLPVFSSDTGSVQMGVIAARAYNRSVLGNLAGQQIAQILKGAQAKLIPISIHGQLETWINLKA
ncbi:MAG: ABC transporter substrate-binding protein, partial [Myxococcaceae bacterium]